MSRRWNKLGPGHVWGDITPDEEAWDHSQVFSLTESHEISNREWWFFKTCAELYSQPVDHRTTISKRNAPVRLLMITIMTVQVAQQTDSFTDWPMLIFSLAMEGGVFVMGTGREVQIKQGPPNCGPPPSLFFSLSLLLSRPPIVPGLTGHSQPVMEMSCGGGRGARQHGVGN